MWPQKNEIALTILGVSKFQGGVKGPLVQVNQFQLRDSTSASKQFLKDQDLEPSAHKGNSKRKAILKKGLYTSISVVLAKMTRNVKNLLQSAWYLPC